MQFKTLIEFFDFFKDEETCERYFERIRFQDGEYCPHCGYTKIYRFKDGKRFRCAKCRKDFTIKTGTIFSESKLTIRQWFTAIYLLTSSKKGISSIQLAKQVGVTQKTGWFMDHRIRKTMKQTGEKLFGTIEGDETYVGGDEKNKHANKRTEGTQGRNTKTKEPVLGLLQRKGIVKTKVVEDVKRNTIEQYITQNVLQGSNLYTDDFRSYARIGRLYTHETIKHANAEYVRNRIIHTNSIESFWALFKRGHYGIYHYMSKKHLQRYLDEFTYRFNNRTTNFNEIFDDTVRQVTVNTKLTYKMLTYE